MARVMTPRIRKAALVAHVVCSVGWLGMALAFYRDGGHGDSERG